MRLRSFKCGPFSLRLWIFSLFVSIVLASGHSKDKEPVATLDMDEMGQAFLSLISPELKEKMSKIGDLANAKLTEKERKEFEEALRAAFKPMIQGMGEIIKSGSFLDAESSKEEHAGSRTKNKEEL